LILLKKWPGLDKGRRAASASAGNDLLVTDFGQNRCGGPKPNTKQKTRKVTGMKTNNSITKRLGLACAALALAASLPLAARGAEQMKPMKGAEHMLMLQGIKTKQDVDALKADDSIAMVCAKCKTVWVTRVKPGVKGAEILNEHGQPAEVIGTHACKGCNSTLAVVGVQKGAHTELKHSCKVCGDESAFCCATKPGAATKGMEKK
jgi:hypothetical protein